MLELLFFEFQKILFSNNVAEDDIKKKDAIQKEAAMTSLAALCLEKKCSFFLDSTLKNLFKNNKILIIKSNTFVKIVIISPK